MATAMVHIAKAGGADSAAVINSSRVEMSTSSRAKLREGSSKLQIYAPAACKLRVKASKATAKASSTRTLGRSFLAIAIK